MANIRFLDQVSVNSFAQGSSNSTAGGASFPNVILPGSTFIVSSNTSVSTYNLSVFGVLILERGPQLQAPDGSIIYANSQLFVAGDINVQGTIINEGLIVVGGDIY